MNEAGGVGALLASNRRGLLTDGTWKCSNSYVAGWSSPSFDVTTWADAYVIGKNGIAPWYARAGIHHDAEWIWTSDYDNGDLEVWCRILFNPCG